LLLHRMARMLDVRSRTFLESVEFEAPDFDLIELPLAGELPAIRRKLMNLGQRSKQKRAADQERLRRAFDQLDLIRSR
ncbi:MAG: nucleotidyl transferase AbiEii/AbiGii toxin family protein, partial [Gammaproteobacteria bacterium]